jgi:hypothetical protein
MSDRPFFNDSTRTILQAARRAARSGDFDSVVAANDELQHRSSQAAVDAAEELEGLMPRKAAARTHRRTGASRQVDAPAPCLYCIRLQSNPKGAGFYVGMSEAHSAACKASIHIDGDYICGLTSSPNEYQRRPVPRDYGLGLHDAKALPTGTTGDALVRREEAWAQEIATATGEDVWCNGKLFT